MSSPFLSGSIQPEHEQPRVVYIRGSVRPGETSLYTEYDHPPCEKDDQCSPGPVQRSLLTTRPDGCPDGRGAAIAGALPEGGLK